jgi:hypothetical protein
LQNDQEWDAVLQMPPTKSVTMLKSFLGSVQLYGKNYLPNLHGHSHGTTDTTYQTECPLERTPTQQEASDKLKKRLSADTALAHFDPSIQ